MKAIFLKNQMPLISLGVLLAMSFVLAQKQEDPVHIVALEVESGTKNNSVSLTCFLKITPPYHVNSDSVARPGLIPTKLVLSDSGLGFCNKKTFPKPDTLILFSEHMLVFDGEITFTQEFVLKPNVRFPVSMLFQYQSCDDEMCYPPEFRKIIINQLKVNGYQAVY
ncbi:MAG: hypothetical protein HQK83_03525 [Fibrobacteria bacterium]|nr:hypothetical protein [Fibrobacteria bacterium]